MNHDFVYGPNALKRLREAGLIGEGIQRVVIDIPHDGYATLYVQEVLDGDLLEILIAEHGNDNRRGLQVKAKAAR